MIILSDDLVKLLNLIGEHVTKDKLGQKYLQQVVSVDYRLEHGRHSKDWIKMMRTDDRALVTIPPITSLRF